MTKLKMLISSARLKRKIESETETDIEAGMKTYESPFHATETKEVADLMVLKVDMLLDIRDMVGKISFTEAIKILNINQTTFSDIMNGAIDLFSVDELKSMLAILKNNK